MPSTLSHRSRTARTTRRRTSPGAPSRIDDLLRDQSLLLRWLLAVVAVVGLTIIVEAWHAPFPHRLGDYAINGIAARATFQVFDEYHTKRARDTAAEAVNPIFVTQSQVLEALPTQLRADLDAIAGAETLTDVPEQTRLKFGLADRSPGTAKSREKRFQALKSAVSVTVEGKGNPIETLLDSFSQLLIEIKGHGIVTADVLKRNELRLDGRLTIIRPDRDGRESVPTESVLLSQALSEKGFITSLLGAGASLRPIAGAIASWLQHEAPVTLQFDRARTQAARQAARQAVAAIFNTYQQEDLIVPPGGRIDIDAIEKLKIENEVVTEATTPGQRIARVIIALVMISVLTLLIASYLYRNNPKLFNSAIRLSVYLGAILLAVLLGRILSHDPWRAEIVPVIAVVMVMAIAYDQMLATITAFVVAALIVLSTTSSLVGFIVSMAVSAAVILPLSSVESRRKLVLAGFLAAGTYFAATIGLGVLERQSFGVVWSGNALLMRSGLGAFWCLVASYFVAGSLPFVENAFGIVTDINLLEMTDVSHPLLQDLVRLAPGTYNHSMAVASIGETAADTIGANGLLVRVGAYFHDVGKMLKPKFFIENVSDGEQSGHVNLAPAMSTLIIIGHVKDGADLARARNLPRRLIDFIEQHHGTTLVEYFFREATRRADQSPDHRSEAEEAAYRYPGPKPQSRETGVIMLADAVESASRTLSEPTPKRIENLVRGIAFKRLLDGQFDESGMTLNEIRTVEDSLIKSLIGIYHGRIKYPDQPSEK